MLAVPQLFLEWHSPPVFPSLFPPPHLFLFIPLFPVTPFFLLLLLPSSLPCRLTKMHQLWPLSVLHSSPSLFTLFLPCELDLTLLTASLAVLKHTLGYRLTQKLISVCLFFWFCRLLISFETTSTDTCLNWGRRRSTCWLSTSSPSWLVPCMCSW